MRIGDNIIYREKLSSTNAVAASLIATEKIPEGTVLHAGYQSDGRGQRGNNWESEAGMNLCMSVILYPGFLGPENQFLISKIISLALCDFLNKYTDHISIKWPNDIYIKDDKIAGILIEHSLFGNSIQSTIAGLGINLNQTVFRSNAPNPISIKNITGKETDQALALKEICTLLNDWYIKLVEGKLSLIDETYNNFLYRMGQWEKFRQGDREFKAFIRGTNQSGHLILEEKGDIISSFAFNEIDFIL